VREASQQAVARRLGPSWEEAHGIMERTVRRGLDRRGQEVVAYLGVDEKSFQKRHEYVTVVCDLGTRRVLDVGDGRGRSSLDRFYTGLSEEQLAGIEGVAMDMWQPYIRSTLEHVPEAEHKIVFDKFHIVAHLKKAVDEVRKAEHRRLRALGEETLTGTKYLWLKGKRRFDPGMWVEFGALRNSDLRTARAWAIVELFSRFWDYVSPTWARKLFERWHAWAIRSRLQPIKKVARMLKAHLPNILTYVRHRIANAATEGINAKIQWIKATAHGFTNRENFRTAILFHCGGLDLYPHNIL
jgi:transposase